MADTDVIGVLSLLCAGAAGIYLLRQRLAAKRDAAAADVPAVTPSERQRRRNTVPPQLRSFAREADIPKEPSERPPALAPSDSEREIDAAAPKAEREPAPAPKSEKKIEAAPKSAPKIEAAPKSAPKIEAPPAPKSEKRLEGKPANKKTDFDDVPKIAVDEDEDLELTKMGKVKGRRIIQPTVERIAVDEIDPARKQEAKVALFAVAQTDPGRRRKQNEDSHVIVERHGLYVVADGMGGHRGGQVASKLAVETIAAIYETQQFEGEPHADIPLPASELARTIQSANATILEEAKAKPELTGMGTTLCAMRFLLDEGIFYLGHVGDSRCYRVRGGAMKQLTTDHTMSDYGIAGPEGQHLSRALGVWPTVPIDVLTGVLELGDIYLLCSDGLPKMIPDGTIAAQLMNEESPKAAVERLVFFANAHGGKDNITVILVRIVEPGWKPPESPRASRPEIA